MTIEKDSAIAEFSMAINKANVDENGEMRWRSVNSDIEKDFYGEKMSLELFSDFDKHITNNESIPDVFKSVICEEDWCGGMPYLSIAHYKSGSGKVNVPGEVQSVYIDGKALKSKGILHKSPLGQAVFKSLRKDIETKATEDKIRVSIGFLDLEHEHVGEGGVRSTFTRKSLSDKCRLCKAGTGTKIYKKGHLVHLALTRVPANPRTDIEVMKSMTTKLEDAKSIIQDEEIEKTLELKSLELKSLAGEALVIKSEEPVTEPAVEPVVEPVATKSIEQIAQESTVPPEVTYSASDVIKSAAAVSVTAKQIINAEPVSKEISALQKSFAALEEKAAVIKSQGLVGDAALKELQSDFERIGETLKADFTPVPSAAQVANQNLEATLRSLLGEMLPQAIAQAVAPMQSELGELRALSLVSKPTIKREEVPQPRGLNAMQLAQKSAIETLLHKTKPVSQFDQIAQASVGLAVQ